MWFFSIILVTILPFLHSACPEVKTCQHGGSFNNKTCSCECYTSYRGHECQFSNCDSQPANCLTDFGPTFCKDTTIAYFCPKMCNQTICKCGFDSCLNGGFFYEASCLCICPNQFTGIRCDNLTSTAQTTTTITTKKTCPQQLQCLNGAKQNTVTCNCDCMKHSFFLFLTIKIKRKTFFFLR